MVLQLRLGQTRLLGTCTDSLYTEKMASMNTIARSPEHAIAIRCRSSRRAGGTAKHWLCRSMKSLRKALPASMSLMPASRSSLPADPAACGSLALRGPLPGWSSRTGSRCSAQPVRDRTASCSEHPWCSGSRRGKPNACPNKTRPGSHEPQDSGAGSRSTTPCSRRARSAAAGACSWRRR